jgi:thermostable 8-oxoguanine DNA glycosylase
MFLMHSRKGQQYAALDTHILKYLRARGHDAPLNTPSPGPKYRALESAFLGHAKKAGMSPADFDLSIWNSYGYAA